MRSLDVILQSFTVLVLSLSFHEAAHAWTADRLGDPTARRLGRLTLNPLAHMDWIGTVLFPLLAMTTNVPLIGWAKPVPVSWAHLRAPRRDFAIVALAGPVSNLILAVVSALLLRMLVRAEGMEWLASFLGRAAVINVALAVFNLIPVPPLDGGNVLSGVVPEGVARAIDHLRPYGFLIIYALMLSGVLATVIWPLADAILGWLL